ncbi:hypothetical protein [Zobellia nedashkovskayae]|uniref:hypothetical protein n=1 Tax=Zobellia nedashkovskayae TaxID=2779510 RepID=UPI001D05550A|nr:hypothetical protein [Zobellia nedashkovskayae]
MKKYKIISLLFLFSYSISYGNIPPPEKKERKTIVTIEKDKFFINGELTYKGRTW